MNVLDYGRRGTERAESCPSNSHREFQARGRCEIGKWRLNCVTLYPDESVQCVVWQLGRHEERGSVVPGIEGIACNRNPRSCMLSMRAGPVGQLTLRDIITINIYYFASDFLLLDLAEHTAPRAAPSKYLDTYPLQWRLVVH